MGKQNFESPLPNWLAANPAAALASHIYSGAVGARNFCYDALPFMSKKLDRPVISVGGIRAGGVGKTPVAQMIGQHIIKERGYGAAYLSRGYGRVSKENVIVPPDQKDVRWEDVGDEPCMIYSNVPGSWLGIGANRAAVARELSPRLPKKSVFIMDDGFQHRGVRRDLDIVCLSDGVFDDRPLPAGYLRESLPSLRRAGVILVVGAEERLGQLKSVRAGVEYYLGIGGDAGASSPVCAILLQYPRSWVEAATGKVVAPPDTPPLKDPYVISGIARPERFIDMAKGLGIRPSEVKKFRDHYKYKNDDLEFARDIYYKGALTTEKDFFRLRSKKLANQAGLWYLKIGLRFADAEAEARVWSRINGILS